MNSMELGRRLKEARLAKKMTQSEVVGDFITRNMLSQIESGSATPSMKTLAYLAGVLDIPMERLVSDQDEDVQPAIAALQDAKRLLAEGDYAAVLDICDPSGLLEDEFWALRSMASLGMAQDLAKAEDIDTMQTALLHARNAARESLQGMYANTARAAQAQDLITRIAQFLSSYYSDLAQAGI